jgi:CRISPR/Cas system CSM-associated protein Csm3 (group 7 of RAMP superfamily)
VWIHGTLSVKEPLHIGDGEILEHPHAGSEDHGIGGLQTIARDIEGFPVIPGTSLKNLLRRFLTSSEEDERSQRLFGREASPGSTEDGVSDTGTGGRVTFYTASVQRGAQQIPADFTEVWTHVVIDRETGAAETRRLFRVQAVRPGTAFHVRVLCDQLTREDVGSVLGALDMLSKGHADRGLPTAIGADCRNGWGRVEWTLLGVEESMRVSDWAIVPFPPIAGRGGELLRGDACLRKYPLSQPPPQAAWLRINLELAFEEGLLVGGYEGAARDHPPEGQVRKAPDPRAQRDAEGKPILPGSSLRGVLRERAEWILRQRSSTHCTPQRPCLDVDNLCCACQLLGARGFASPLWIPIFHLISGGQRRVRTRNALDRWTGGTVNKMLWDTEYFDRPILSGVLFLECRATCDAEKLLTLLLRDLREGWIAVGGSTGVGFGTCASNTRIDYVYPQTWGTRHDSRQGE